LLACWIAVYLLFFSIAATKLPNYVLPTVVPCAVLVGRFLQRWQNGSLQLPRWFLLAGMACLVLIGFGISTGLAIVGGVGELAVVRGRFFHGLEVWAALGLVPIIAAVAGWAFVRNRQPNRFILAVSVTAILLLAPMAAFGSVLFNRYKAPRALAEQAELLRRDEDIRIGCWQMDHLPSLNFYVQRNVEHLHHESDIARFLDYRLPAYLLLPAQEWERVQKDLGTKGRVVGRQYDLYHHAEVVVVTNR
jgi:4-amino-4-deoxy-L-arabinose transferase-like glycosyltransferase